MVTTEQLVISALFTTLSTFAGTVIKLLWARVQSLESKLDESNEASRDLIALQAKMLKDNGVTITTPSREGRDR